MCVRDLYSLLLFFDQQILQNLHVTHVHREVQRDGDHGKSTVGDISKCLPSTGRTSHFLVLIYEFFQVSCWKHSDWFALKWAHKSLLRSSAFMNSPPCSKVTRSCFPVTLNITLIWLMGFWDPYSNIQNSFYCVSETETSLNLARVELDCS